MRYVRKEKKIVTLQNTVLTDSEKVRSLLECLKKENIFIEIEFRDPKSQHVMSKTDARISCIKKEEETIDISVFSSRNSFYNVRDIPIVNIECICLVSDRDKMIVRNPDLSRFAILDIGD